MALNDSFQSLVGDITEQVLQKVQTQVQGVITDSINQRLADTLSGDTLKSLVNSRINENLQNYTPDLAEFEQGLQATSANILNNLNVSASKLVTDLISEKINSLDIDNIVEQFILTKLDPISGHYPFKDGSISGSAIDRFGLHITGDNIEGGVVTKFASTGIDDQASQCQLTILDQGAVFENTLYAGALEVKGGATIDGDLTILGRIADSPAYQQLVSDISADTQSKIGPEVLDQYQNRVFERLQTEGLDLSKVTFNGKTIIIDDRLVNISRVGVLRDFQTEGETFLSQALYVSNKRVGVNTIEPGAALSIWDQEVEVGVGKQSQDVAELGTPRPQTLILSSNKQNNVTLTPDGNVAVAKLKIGNMQFSTSAIPPHYNADRGTVVFNEQPNLGGPLGWVSLGDAKWANFGIID